MLTPAPNSTDPLAERLILEQAEAFAQELLRVPHDAPDGQVLRLTELFVLERGREFLRFALTNALQHQADAVEKQGAPSRTCSCSQRRDNKGHSNQKCVTAVGTVTLRRRNLVCIRCRDSLCPWDARLGLNEYPLPASQTTLLSGRRRLVV